MLRLLAGCWLIALSSACGTRTGLDDLPPTTDGGIGRVRTTPPVGPSDAAVDAAIDSPSDPPPPPQPPAPPQPPPPPGSECVDGINGDRPPSEACFAGSANLAFEFVPRRDILVERVELHTDSGGVAFLDDATATGGESRPGEVIAEAPLSMTTGPAWISATFDPPVRLTGGQRIWIAHTDRLGVCNIAADGEMPRYYGGFGVVDGPWEGPYTQFAWAARLYGECPP